MGNKVELYDEYGITCAILCTANSEDPKTKVGSCIIDNNHKIIGIGSNRAPFGFGKFMIDNDCWNSESDVMHKKNTFVLHSELAAIIDAYKKGNNVDGATLYVTLFPCNECAKAIIESGIKRVCYLEMYSKSDKVEATKIMFKQCGIECVQYGTIENNIAYKQKVLSKIDDIKNFVNK